MKPSERYDLIIRITEKMVQEKTLNKIKLFFHACQVPQDETLPPLGKGKYIETILCDLLDSQILMVATELGLPISEPTKPLSNENRQSGNLPAKSDTSISSVNVLEQREERYNYALQQVYLQNVKEPNRPAILGSISEERGWSDADTQDTLAYMLERKYVRVIGGGGGGVLMITHEGVLEAESQLADSSEGIEITHRRQRRWDTLRQVYELTGSDFTKQIDLHDVKQKMGLSGSELKDVYDFLCGANWIKPRGAGYYIVLTPEGRRKAEEPISSSADIQLFYCYAHKDEDLRDELDNHLQALSRQGLISGWHDRCISAGTDWDEEISAHLEQSRIVLLLISSDFIASDYCWSKETKRALERHRTGEARVIPVILRPCYWQSTDLGCLQALPKNGEPVTGHWHSHDEAFLDIVKGIERVIQDIKGQQS